MNFEFRDKTRQYQDLISRATLERFMPGLSENYGSSPLGRECYPTAIYDLVDERRVVMTMSGYFGGTAAWSNHAFRRTLHLRQRDISRRVSISWATRYRARARRRITRAVKAPRSSGSCSTYANPTAVCIYARSSSTSGARETSLRKRSIDRSSRALITRSVVEERHHL